MKPLLTLVFLLSCLTLGACGDAGGESMIYTPPDSSAGRLCTAHCSETHNICRNDCSLGQRECLNKAQGQALIDYEKYMSEQFLHASAIEYRVKDFEHLGPCEDGFKSCAAACETPYQACYEKCGGDVEKFCGFLCF